MTEKHIGSPEEAAKAVEHIMNNIKYGDYAEPGSLPDLDSVKEVVSASPEETDVAPILEQKDIKKFETSQMGMAEFEAQVTLALKTGHHWLEVPKETLLMVCAGEYPTEHYICYKGLKVAAEGTAKDCMAKEKTTAHERVFPKDTFKVR